MPPAQWLWAAASTLPIRPAGPPDPDDEIIARYAEPERPAWMHANFAGHAPVAELGGTDSYATRLFDYEHTGRDQVAWVISRLRADPAARSAAITTFQPHTDTSYIPCVSLLGFWLPGGALELIVKSAHVYETERSYLLGVLADSAATAGSGQRSERDQTGR